MATGIYQLIDAALVQQARFDNIAHNMANTATNGYKKDVFTFEEAYSSIANSTIDFTVGPIIQTGNSLDLALEGPGFFKVQTSQGFRYTRDGAFALNRERMIVTQSGDQILGQNGPIAVEGEQVSIDRNGQVFSDGQLAGQIAVVNVDDTRLLSKEGRSLYRYEGDQGGIKTAADPGIRQRYLEKSNVIATEEMVKMIETFRAFESVQKAIQSIDEMVTKMINDPGLAQ